VSNSRIWIEAVLYGAGAGRRFTQDSPVLPDVWVRYLEQPEKELDLLIEPWLETQPSRVAGALLRRFKNESEGNDPDFDAPDEEPSPADEVAPVEALGPEQDSVGAERGRTTYNRTMVVSQLVLRDLIRHVIPLTFWYRNASRPNTGPREALHGYDGLSSDTHENFVDRLPRAAQLWEDVVRLDRPLEDKKEGYAYPKILSLVRIAGLIAFVGLRGKDAVARELDALADVEDEAKLSECREVLARYMVSGFRQVIGNLPKPGKADLIYTINRNRKASLAVVHSIKTVKADAAGSLFSINCKKITWAVIDSGIEARHPAFIDWSKPNAAAGGLEVSRVKETYDFSYLRELLLNKIPANAPERCKKLQMPLPGEPPAEFAKRKRNWAEVVKRIRQSRAVDWELLLPLIKIPHTVAYSAPTDGHGTHVAGILGADWWGPPSPGSSASMPPSSAGLPEPSAPSGQIGHPDGWTPIMRGLCPDIKLIDIRVCRDDGSSDEFVIMSALQFLRYLNANTDFIAVHGINMSLSLVHDAANYACGQTPICDEADRTVSSGVVVVAAAGNLGYKRLLAEGNQPYEQFCPVSITDPGNAESVITVGATHRLEPHSYGVSYFSSRGPTGDGRVKPDLVAPGEKIFAPTLEQSAVRLDGTSMAAPHVSGAAAMLMARHVELAGRPQKIKEILCATATDLGRERYFQGHGLVDVLRAMQSV
jgi:serine protease AprX